jgi:hypothetical protein
MVVVPSTSSVTVAAARRSMLAGAALEIPDPHRASRNSMSYMSSAMLPGLSGDVEVAAERLTDDLARCEVVGLGARFDGVLQLGVEADRDDLCGC